MACYAKGPVCPYECMPCDECPAGKPEYAAMFEASSNKTNAETRKFFVSTNIEKIEKIHSLLNEVLQVAPDDNECTCEADYMFSAMQRLTESIEHWKAKGSVVFKKV